MCKLEHRKPFEGKAKIELLGLPPNTTAAPKEITAKDEEVVFDVTTDAKTPTGQHKSLFCAVTMTQAGESLQQTVAGGGVLRIDPAALPKPVQASAKTPPAEEKKPAPAKPISRLEKLRQEAEQTK
jgi:hypothetical protein